jgi:hypothetical protein
MINYFHKYPTCPCCHEPHSSGSIIKIIDYRMGLLKCSSCKAYFYENIDFTQFKKTWRTIKGGSYEYNAFIKKVPLLWIIHPNVIEEAYLDWLSVDTSGKYLITWPWKEVKFIPLLITNLALENPVNKIVVISNFKNINSTDNDEFPKPEFDLIIDNLFYSNDLTEMEIDEDIVDDARKFDRKNVLEKRNKISYHIKIVKPLNYAEQDFEVDNSVDAENCSYRRCKTKLKNKLDNAYGENSIKLFKWKDREIWKRTPPDKINPDGYFEISLEEQPRWGGKLKFDKISYWKALSNINELIRVNKKISSIKILDDNLSDMNIENNRIFFIPDYLNADQIFNAVKKINPEIVIFTKSDTFIEDKSIFNGQKGRAFIKFLDTTNKTVLMFSVKPDSRHLYKIGLNDGFTDKYDITVHTWDSGSLMEKIINNNNSSTWISATSSCFNEFKLGSKISAEYILLKCLDSVEEVISQIIQIMDNYHIKKFFYELIKTPLYINETNIYTNFRRGNWIFDNIMGYILENNYDAFQEIIKPFNDYYLVDDEPSNPIMNKIIELLTDFIQRDNNVVFISVPNSDKKGTEQILIENGFEDYIPEKVRISTWNELSDFEIELEPEAEFYVISAINPYITYEFEESDIKNFIFIGSSQNIEDLKTILENRLNEKNKRPLYIPSPEESLPKLLKCTLNELQNMEKINNMVSELTFEENVKPTGEKKLIKSLEGLKTHQMKIDAGEEVIIVVDEDGNGLFLPLDRIISFKSEYYDSIEDIKVLKSSIDDLKGKEIIIDEHGFYASYKLIFTKFVVEMGENTLIKTPLYTWKGFKDLIYSASEWMRLLRKSLNRIQEDKKISENEAKDELASILVDLDIHASHQSYVKNFWFAEPSILDTSCGKVQIYEIEHPRGFKDLIEIYEKVDELLPEIDLETSNARRSYTAAITLQNIRMNFFRGRNIPPEYRYLYDKLHEEIKIIVRNSAKFKVESATTVKLNKEVYPFRILQNFQEYY